MAKNKKDKKFETLISRTKIYLILIAILLIILCINDTSYIVPSIVIYGPYVVSPYQTSLMCSFSYLLYSVIGFKPLDFLIVVTNLVTVDRDNSFEVISLVFISFSYYRTSDCLKIL